MQSTIAVVSYGLAATAFLLLTGLLLVRWRGRQHGLRLAAACFATTLWAGMIALQAAHGLGETNVSGILEALKVAAWSTFLLCLLHPAGGERAVGGISLNRQALFYATAFGLFVAARAIGPFVDGPLRALCGLAGGSVGGVLLAVMGMLLIEQLLRNANPKERWAIKFACLGIGGMFAYDFYFYVDALLFRQVDREIWLVRGAANALAVPLIAVSAARNPTWSIAITVSRRIIFHSATLIGAALYLMVVAAAGYYLRFFGGEWGTVLQATFLLAAFTLLVAILISGGFRAWLRVFISKNFYSYGYDYREEWLKFTRTLSVEGPQLGERAIQAIADLVESPKGILMTRKEGGPYELSASWNITTATEPIDAGSPLCEFMRATQWVIDLQEFDEQPEKYPGLAVPEWMRRFPQAWLIVPLVQNGALHGFVLLARSRSRIELNWEILDLLKIVGIQAASHLARQESANALSVARQFETYNRMSTFVVHDLKNLVAQLGLLVANAEKYGDRPEFQKDMVETIDHAVRKMRVLLQKFNREAMSETSNAVRVDELLAEIVAARRAIEPRPTLLVGDRGLHVYGNAGRLERVIGHLVQNAIEATPRDGSVTVRALREDGHAVIEVADTGRGMSEEFVRDRLFRPFESTKAAGMGIGVFETREYVHHIGGRLEVDSAPGRGTTFRVHLPLHVAEHEAVSTAA